MKTFPTFQIKCKSLAAIGKAGVVRSAMMVMGLASGIAVGEEEQDPRLPKTPTAFETENTGKGGEAVATVQKVEGKTRKVTVIAVTKSRKWKDIRGKIIMARLLAFESTKGGEPPLVRNGNIRLLVDGAKGYHILPLSKLSADDQAYVKGLATARKKEAQAGKNPK